MREAPLIALLLAGLVSAPRAQCVQAGKLLPPLPDMDREFGTSVATDGDLLVVGAPVTASRERTRSSSSDRESDSPFAPEHAPPPPG